ERPSTGRHGDDGPDTLAMLTLDETTVVGVLPHGKARARAAPGVHDFGVRSRLGTDPFEKVEYQGVDEVGHCWLPSVFIAPPTSQRRGFVSRHYASTRRKYAADSSYPSAA